MKWIKKSLGQYADFSSRSQRIEYWHFLTFFLLVLLCMNIADTILGLNGVLTILVGLIFVLPALAVTSRRLHDINKSAWWLLLLFVPFIGNIFMLIIGFIDSKDDNLYGDNPKSDTFLNMGVN